MKRFLILLTLMFFTFNSFAAFYLTYDQLKNLQDYEYVGYNEIDTDEEWKYFDALTTLIEVDAPWIYDWAAENSLKEYDNGYSLIIGMLTDGVVSAIEIYIPKDSIDEGDLEDCAAAIWNFKRK